MVNDPWCPRIVSQTIASNLTKYVRFYVIDVAFQPVRIFQMHREAAKFDVYGHPSLGQWGLRRMLHVVLSQLLLDFIEVGASREFFNHLEVIELPKLNQFLLINRQHESLIVHLVFVNNFGKSLDFHDLIVFDQHSFFLFRLPAESIVNFPLLTLVVTLLVLRHLEAVESRRGSAIPDEAIMFILSDAGYRCLLLMN